MTNKEKLSKIIGEEDSVDIVAVKMLLTEIQKDYDSDLFEQNYEKYLSLYRSTKDWLNSEVE